MNKLLKQTIILTALSLFCLHLQAQLLATIDETKSKRYQLTTKFIKKIVYKNSLGVPMPLSANIESFQVVSEHYAKDRDNIFYQNKKLTNGDVPSFNFNSNLGLHYDKDFIYEEKPKGNNLVPYKDIVDTKSYEKMALKAECLKWYKDKYHYYYNHKLTLADRKLLNFKSEYLPFDDKYIFRISRNHTCEPYLYKGKVTVVFQNVVFDDKYIFISSTCGKSKTDMQLEVKDPITISFEERDNLNSFDIDAVSFAYDDILYLYGVKITHGIKEKIDFAYFKKIGENYYAYKQRIYFLEKEILKDIEGADAASFKVLKRGYSKDKNSVYLNGKVQKQHDAASFEVFDRYIKDKHTVYYYNVALEGTDSPTFKEYSSYIVYAKDRLNVYIGSKIIKDVDVATFESVLEGEMADGAGYFKDKNKVYFWTNHDLLVLDKADVASFEVKLQTFMGSDDVHRKLGMDKTNIYFREQLVSEDKKSFKLLRYPYAKDSKKVFGRFFKGIVDADPASFVVLDNSYTKDKKYVYKDEKILEGYKPEKFYADKCGRYPVDSDYGNNCYRGVYGGGDDDDD